MVHSLILSLVLAGAGAFDAAEPPPSEEPHEAPAAVEEPEATAPDDPESAPQLNLRPDPPEPVPPEALEKAIERGVAFLLEIQDEEGWWGSPERTKDLNIIAGVGSHHAFRVAVTAMAVSALIEVGGDSETVRHAIERGEDYLLRELPKVRRDSPMLIYNVWTHAYGIQALVRMHGRLPCDSERQTKIEAMIREQYDYLTRYESVEGGWGYYDFGAGTQRPNSSSQSFVNAAVLVGWHEAKQIGVEPPENVTKRAIESIELQRLPDFSYLYGMYSRYRPRWDINRPGGSLGRTQACNLALRLWGDETVTDDVIQEWLDRLITRNGWLDMGRKRPIPHESYFLVAGYFYFFGHYYAALSIDLLPPDDRPFYQDHLARILINVQEPNGSWWDYPFYNYHEPYGTAFALMSLNRCRKAEEP